MSNPIIITELKRIAAAHNGKLMPADVVESARPKSSPLHSRFEWDNTEAAERYRLWQARQLISVTVEYLGSGEQASLEKVFVSLTTDRDRGGYRSLVTVMSDQQHRERLLEDALDEMRRFHKKYKELNELAAVFEAMKQVSKKSRRSTESTVNA